MAPTADTVVVELVAETRAYQTALQAGQRQFAVTVAGVQAGVKNLGVAIGGLKNTASSLFAALAVQRIYSFVRGTIDETAAMVDLSERLKINTDLLQQYQYAAAKSNIESGEFSNILSYFARQVGDAGRGTGELLKVLQANGIAFQDSAGKARDLNLVFEDYIDLMSRSTEASSTAKLSQIGFGRSAQEVGTLATDGAAGLRALGEEAKRAGAILDRTVLEQAHALDDEFVKVEKQIAKTFQTLAISAGPAIVKVIEALNSLVTFLDAHPVLTRTLGLMIAGGRIAGLPGALAGGALSVGIEGGEAVSNQVDKLLADLARAKAGEEEFRRYNESEDPGAPRTRNPRFGIEPSKPGVPKGLGERFADAFAATPKPEPIIPPSDTSPNEFQKALQALRERIDLMRLEEQTLGGSTGEIARRNAALVLEQQATAANIELTPKMREEIEKLSEELGNQVDALDRTQQAYSRIQEAAQQSFDAVKSGLADVIFGASSFEEALGGVLKRFAEIRLNAALDQLFAPSQGGAAGGKFGNIFGSLGKFLGGGVPGFAAGGEGVFAGSGGTDSKLIRVTPGERFKIWRPDQPEPGGGGTVRVAIELNGEILMGTIVNTTGNVAAQITKENNKTLPSKVGELQRRGIY